MKREHRVGVVLSGGGVRGASHVGLLKALADRGIEPTAVAGASSGALVGTMYAARRSFNQTLDVFRDNDLFSWNYLGLVRKPGLLDTELLLGELDAALDHRTFDDLTRELHVVAGDLLTGEPYFFKTGPLARAVLASCAYPGVLTPIEHEGRLLSDGGIVNNLPVEPLLGRCDLVIGSFVNPVAPMTLEQLQTTFAVSQRAFQIGTTHALTAKLAKCDFAIAPLPLLDIGLFELSRTNEAFEIGLSAANAIMDDVEARLAEIDAERAHL
ncbi:MAG: patatin-like phospholipase family protein [Myxococcota bacterium]